MPKRRTTQRRQKGGFIGIRTNRKKKRTPGFWAGLGQTLVRQRGRGFGTIGAIAGAAGMAALKKGLKRRRR